MPRATARPARCAALETLLATGARRARSNAAYDEGAQLMGRGATVEGRAAFERAVAIDPDNARAWVVLAERRRLDGDLAGSAAAIEHARSSDDVQVRGDAEIMAGMLALAKQDPAGALASFAAAQRLVPGNARAYLYEAQVYAQSGNARRHRGGVAARTRGGAGLARVGGGAGQDGAGAVTLG